jgi:hypothetical protein
MGAFCPPFAHCAAYYADVKIRRNAARALCENTAADRAAPDVNLRYETAAMPNVKHYRA